jgi:hypothetical protein
MPVNMRVTGLYLVFSVWLAAVPAWAQDEFGISDNSFLVEEAFNQDAGIFQNIATYRWQRGQWLGSFTQEWPFPSMTHQLSFTMPFGRVAEHAAIGDVLINYRLQALREGERRPAFSPRLSVIVPSASAESGLGNGEIGWQINLPFSKRARDWYFHWNGGVTFSPGDEDTFGENAESLVSPFVAGSAIWRASSRLNLLVELVAESNASPGADGEADRSRAFTVSPGFRYAWNPADQQVVVGIAAPMTRSDAVTRGGVFAYFSYELPFK